MMAFDIEKLQQKLSVKLENAELFKTSFTHRSYLNEHPDYKLSSNERLEFLGDAVLQLLSSEYLYKKYPNSPEGVLTNYRSAIVCTPSIAQEAKKLGYGELLLLSNGEETTGGRDREYILANTFEAVLGALYTEKGLEYCRTFVNKNLFYKVDEIVENEDYKDAKSRFQEAAQEKHAVTPTYQVLEAWGPDHEKMFKVGVFLGAELWGTGEGRSKQKAEQQAAIDALTKITQKA
jgi:ribonuclease III